MSDRYGINDVPTEDPRQDLVIGRALDALDRLEVDVTDDDEVREYLEVLSYLPLEEIAPPTTLESRVLDAARRARIPGVPSLVARRRKTARIAVLGAAAAVAAAVGFMVVADSGTNTTGAKIEIVSSSRSSAVDRVPNHKLALTAPNGDVDATLLVANRGGAVELADTSLQSTPAATYWLWVSGPNNNALVETPLDDLVSRTIGVKGSMTGAFITAERPGVMPTHPGQVVARGTL